MTFVFFRTAPEDFSSRVNFADEQRKKRDEAEAGKEFSFPSSKRELASKPKYTESSSSGMVKEKVR